MSRWDTLHRQEQHQLAYPSEHVVRWLSSFPLPKERRALDIGCGFGRHLKVLRAFHYDAAVGVDSSMEAVLASRAYACCPAQNLPFSDDLFDIALAYGVFYYGTRQDHEKAVSEMWRVLRPSGRAFVCVRTDRDWRLSQIQEGEPEYGMEIDLLAEEDIPNVYGIFDGLTYELTETTTDQRNRRNSDWLISLTK